MASDRANERLLRENRTVRENFDMATAEVRRLTGFLEAIDQHGRTTWASTAHGAGVGGQALSESWHTDAIDCLLRHALAGHALTEAADEYDGIYPGSRRLDDAPAQARRPGPDGRPV
jgi:hypothetical protein